MDFISLFVDIFNKIKDFVLNIIDILIFIPSFVIEIIGILPSEIQFLFGTVMTIICVALIYRFIK